MLPFISSWTNVTFFARIVADLEDPLLTSSMTEQMCRTHWVMACGVPEIVTALSVESGSMSPATWTWAPVVFTSTRQQKKQQLFTAEKSTPSPKLKCCFEHPQISPNTFWHAWSSCKPNSKVCSNIWRGTHKYRPFRTRFHPPPIFTGRGIFHERQTKKKKYTHKAEKSKWNGTNKFYCLILEVLKQQGGGFLLAFCQ